ncbi:hypothetical protein [Streptomyces sp. NPDC086838]|uniref:hypothetical protein n=1 Tax=Streptomyces sp. NPDC086838 TaxID=3365762 RepID=UPI00381EE7D5
MLGTVADHSRPLRRAAAAVGAVALIAMAAAPASADTGGRVPGDLVLGPMTSVAGVKTGSVVEVPGLFANKGDKALEKIFLSYQFSEGLAYGGALSDLPSNCTLLGSDIEDNAIIVQCELEQTFKAGGIYAPEKLPLKVLDEGLNESVSVMVSTYDPSPEGLDKAWPGTGPAMRLPELPPTTPVGDGHEPSRRDDLQWDGAGMRVDVVNTADLRMALREKSRAGKTLTLEATFSNAGPGEVKHYDSETSLTKFQFKAPAGTTVTKIDNRCHKITTGSYTCVPYTHPNLWVGATDSFAVTLRVDRAVPGAKASASLENKARPYDKNKKNDSATLLINKGGDSTGGTGTTNGGATGGSSTGGHTTGGSSAGGGSTGGDGSTSSTGGSTGTGGSGSTGGSATGGSATTGSSGASATGGNLASTGSGATLPLAGAAAATLAVGAGAVLLVRRRAARS